MKENHLPVAWMLRQDGTAVPCIQHLYGSEDCVEETLYAAQWLYHHTDHQTTRSLVLELVASYGESLCPGGDIVGNLLKKIEESPYVFLTEEFVKEHRKTISHGDFQSVEKLNLLVIARLNQEFSRVRLGGLYHTIWGCRDLYFRISSQGFNWSEAIMQFLNREAGRFDTLTIVQDEESTGEKEYFEDVFGRVYNHYPWKLGETVCLLPK